MTQAEQKILLQDLCARLPYDIMCEVFDPQQEYEEDVFNAHLIQIDAWTSHCYFWGCSETDPYDIEQVKPYLRPMSSMTKEECIELGNIEATIEGISKVIPNVPYYIEVASSKQIDWLNRKMFDYRGLIPMGLALEAPEGMYNFKKTSNIKY